jgi:hypothetical protein
VAQRWYTYYSEAHRLLLFHIQISSKSGYNVQKYPFLIVLLLAIFYPERRFLKLREEKTNKG